MGQRQRLFAMVKYKLMSLQSAWTVTLVDDSVIYRESREQVEENPEWWRHEVKRRGMKICRSKTE